MENNVTNNEILDFFSSRGYQFQNENGSVRIAKYSNPDDELYSLYNGVGLRFLSSSVILELRGKDSLDFLHRISTNNLQLTKKESVKKTIFTSEKGRILGVSTVINFESHILLVTEQANRNKIISWLKKYIIADDVEVNDANHRFNIFEFSGPQSDSFLTWVCGNTISDIDVDSFKVMNVEGILFFLAKMIDERGLKKFWVLADSNNSVKLMNYVLDNTGPFDFNLVGDEAFNSFRIEQGIPVEPNELNDQFNPHEAKLVHLIDFEKGCYIGQEVIARLETYDKVQKQLSGVYLSENIETDLPIQLFNESGDEAGTVTSATDSLKLKKLIGLAYIRKQYSQAGTKLFTNSNGKKIEVTVNGLPFRK